MCFLLGLLGTATAIGLQYWATAVSWPINVGGKPWNSLPAFVPITFEMMVLFAGVGTVAAFIWVARLRPGRAAQMSGRRITDDRFALVVRCPHEPAGRSAMESLLSPFHPVTFEERDAY